MISIFIFISGATLLVYSAERLIISLVGVSRGLAVSVFLLAIIFTGIEFDDIVLGIALNLENDQDVALGLVLGTAVSFSGIVLALGAILAPTTFSIPREYIVVFALAPLIMVVFAIRKEVTSVDAIVLILLFVAWIMFVAVRERKRETATFRNLEIIEEAEEQEEGVTSELERVEGVDTKSRFSLQGRWSGWINLGLAAVAICGIIIGAATVSEGTDQILSRYTIAGTVFGATIVTARAVDRGPLPHRTADPKRRARDRHRQRHRQPHLLGDRQARDRCPRRRQRRDRLERPALAPPRAHRADRPRRVLHVDWAHQALAGLPPTRPVRGLLGHQLRRLRRRPGRGLNAPISWDAVPVAAEGDGEQEWVVLASFENRRVAERMVASLGRGFRKLHRKGHATALVISGNEDGSLSLTQSRVVSASGVVYTGMRISLSVAVGFMGMISSLQGAKGAVHEVHQRGSHAGTAQRRAQEILAEVGPDAAVVLISSDDQATRQAAVAAAADRATRSWDGSRETFLAGLEPGSEHDWVRAALDEPVSAKS